jgi:Domain of unknown function (DUF1989)
MHDEAAHTTPPPDAAARCRAPPVLTYSVEQLPSFDDAFYNAARAELSKVAELTVLPREAKAFEVPAGHFFRIVSIEGPQVGDLNLWNAHDLTERFYSGKTRALHATHLSTGKAIETGSGARSRVCVQWPPSPMTPSTGMGGTKMAQGCTIVQTPISSSPRGLAEALLLCRTQDAFWSAARRWAERAVMSGLLSVDDLRNGAGKACTLLLVPNSAAPIPVHRKSAPGTVKALDNS